ncbi:MAG: hypothetical protein AAGK02_04650 [Pseudomonadota bacterium]
MATETIDLGYRPRDWAVGFHTSLARFRVAVIHRRGGKTVGSIADMVDAALRCTLKRPRYAYIAPLLRQAKQVAWDYLKDYCLKIPGAQANEAELRIDLPNGARIQVFGADNYDALRGIYLDGVILDEFGDMDPRAWVEVIRPALADRVGWAIFIGTPKGRNEFHKLYEHAGEAQGWERFMLKASQSGLIDASELTDARAIMTEDQYAQEFECSFDAAIQGAFFAEEFRLVDADERITGVPWQPGQKVFTAWDLGIDDATAIWFGQQAGREIHLIDYMEVSGEGLPAIVKRLDAKPYAYDKHLLPHDVEARELGTGETRRETLKGLGVDCTVLPQQNVEDGIHSARMILSRCWFDARKTERGIECLRQYRREFDDKRKVFRERPLHDWTSHAADAFRYLAMGIERVGKKPKALEIPDFGAV